MIRGFYPKTFGAGSEGVSLGIDELHMPFAAHAKMGFREQRNRKPG